MAVVFTVIWKRGNHALNVFQPLHGHIYGVCKILCRFMAFVKQCHFMAFGKRCDFDEKWTALVSVGELFSAAEGRENTPKLSQHGIKLR